MCGSIAAADGDGDNNLDVLLGNDGGPSRALLNAGDGTRALLNVITSLIAAADLDGGGEAGLCLHRENIYGSVYDAMRAAAARAAVMAAVRAATGRRREGAKVARRPNL